MDNPFNILVAAYEQEKRELQRYIDEYLLEYDFDLADHYQKALFRIDRKLDILRGFEDKHIRDKSFLETHTRHLRKLIEGGLVEELDKMAHAQLAHYEKELDRLNSIPRTTAYTDSETIFEQLLQRLIKHEIKSLRFVVNRSENFRLEFAYSGKKLKIVLPSIKTLLRRDVLSNRQIKKLIDIGFNMDVRNEKLTIIVEDEKAELLIFVKQLIARLVFDVFYIGAADVESYFEFTERKNRI